MYLLHLLLNRSRVSIQLVSPASGDEDKVTVLNYEANVSIQLVSPASGDCLPTVLGICPVRFPFN